MSSDKIYVSVTLGDKTIPVGRLWYNSRNGKETSSFEYNESWLTHSERFALEPALKLTPGTYHTPAAGTLFGSIGDSAPDRWGRVLMKRREAQQARKEKRSVRTLSELDYLLGVNDEIRQGALRFSETPDGEFLSPGNINSVPPLIRLPELLSASDNFQEENDSAEDLRILLAPGSSLGGARPKASVKDRDGSLAIAKFPQKNDDFNISTWEAVALTLAKQAGIRVPEWKLASVLGKDVLIVKRFDRNGISRIPFLSAMSMLGAKDNDLHSYIEIAYALIQNGASPDEDLEELWRRIIFSVLISNTDDHLRNHGFLYESPYGWRLSPAYDINPVPIEIRPRILSTSINYDDPTASIDTAVSVAGEFRLSKEKASAIIREVYSSVQKWEETAGRFNIGKQEIVRMRSAFEHSDSQKAKNI